MVVSQAVVLGLFCWLAGNTLLPSYIRNVKQRTLRLLLLLLAITLVRTLQPSIANADNVTPPFVPNQYIIKYRTSTSHFSKQQARMGLRVKVLKELPVSRAELVSALPGEEVNHTYLKNLLAQGLIEYAEPNYIISLSGAPNDPRFSELWGLHNTGQTNGTADMDINAPEAWNLTTGSSDVVVGVVDTGVNYLHPDLVENIWTNPNEIPNNGLDDDGNGVVDDIHGFNAVTRSGNPLDDHGHGSHCAGTIGAHGNNQNGIAGVNWNVKIMGLKFLSASGSGSTADAILAIDYAVSQKRAGVNLRVLSNSWGGGGFSQALEDAISEANDAGILFVAASGNSGLDTDSIPNYPSNYELSNVLSVAAVDQDGNLASFSNYGATSVDLAAPGVSILSTVTGRGYATYSGTSMATPHVSGVAALVLAREPSLSTSQLKARLVNSVKALTTLTGVTVSGGMVDAYNALTNSSNPTNPSPPSISYQKTTASFRFDTTLGEKVLELDDGYTAVNLGFSFPFYKKAFSTIAISSNGRLIPLDVGEALPNSPDYANRLTNGISPFHDDLYPAPPSLAQGAGGVWFKSSASEAVFTWVMVSYGHRSSTDPETLLRFQAQLKPDGSITFAYDDTYTGEALYDYGASATIGLAAPTGVSGERLLVSNNSANENELGSLRSLNFRLKKKGVLHDIDGDDKSDLILWNETSGVWSVLRSQRQFKSATKRQYQLGLPGDLPLVADYDGDKKADLSVWRRDNGTWYFRLSSNSFQDITAIQWGLPGDQPLTGDFDGDGKADLSVYRTTEGVFYILLSSAQFNRDAAMVGNSSAVLRIAIGGPGFDPIIGDFDGDGLSNPAVIWQPARYWSVMTPSGSLLYSLPWGNPGDTPLACDWDGDGSTDRIVVRANPAAQLDWFAITKTGAIYLKTFGKVGDTPSCDKDIDGDQQMDLGVYRPNKQKWVFNRSRSGTLTRYGFGSQELVLPK